MLRPAASPSPQLLGAHADPHVGEALGHALRVEEDLLAVHVGAYQAALGGAR